jgi:S-adenosylmethionine:tRNA ribosyltransferase-isomerase
VEVFFSTPSGERAWEVLCRPGKRIRAGDHVVFAGGKLTGVFGDERQQGLRLLHIDAAADDFEDFLEVHGHIPLPPYIDREDTPADAVEYQTVYAQNSGAVAAPTAGLHFTDSLLQELRNRSVEIVTITLHVGVGTFIPVRTEDPLQHVLRPERFRMSAEAAARLNAAKDGGRRIVAVGTTTTRTLEYIMKSHGRFAEASGEADIFILPGYEFRAVDAMLTNFHLPKSTLLMLVAAFASREKILAAYTHAVEERYRFYSYGDCMLLA